MNKITFYLTMSDIFTWGLILVLGSITGLYIAQKLETDNAVRIVGLGVSITSVCRALLQIPIGKAIDKLKTERDDILVLFAGNLFMGAPYVLFPFIQSEITFYVLQAITGMGMAMNLVSWRKLFAKSLDKDSEGLTYGTYDTIMSVSMAAFSFSAGIIANLSQELFDLVIIAIGLVMMTSGFWAYRIFKAKYSKHL